MAEVMDSYMLMRVAREYAKLGTACQEHQPGWVLSKDRLGGINRGGGPVDWSHQASRSERIRAQGSLNRRDHAHPSQGKGRGAVELRRLLLRNQRARVRIARRSSQLHAGCLVDRVIEEGPYALDSMRDAGELNPGAMRNAKYFWKVYDKAVGEDEAYWPDIEKWLEELD